VGDILASGMKSLKADLAVLPPDAKAALVIMADNDLGEIVVGTAANLGNRWVLSAEAVFALRQRPSGRFALGKVW
jgi:hypothetical protein